MWAHHCVVWTMENSTTLIVFCSLHRLTLTTSEYENIFMKINGWAAVYWFKCVGNWNLCLNRLHYLPCDVGSGWFSLGEMQIWRLQTLPGWRRFFTGSLWRLVQNIILCLLFSASKPVLFVQKWTPLRGRSCTCPEGFQCLIAKKNKSFLFNNI